MKNKRIACITGITGYIGSNLAKRLVKEQWEIHGIIRTTSKIEKIEESIRKQITFHNYEEQNNNFKQIIKQIKPEIVFHLASKIVDEHTYENIDEIINSNIRFGTQLIEAMVKNNIYKLINTGTYWQHYNNEPYNPVNLYAASKQAFEAIIKYYQETTPLKVTTLKLFDTYGPGDTRPKLFTILNRITETGEELAMSKGEQKIDIVYIDDVVKAYILAAQYLLEEKKEYIGEYAVSSGEQIPLTQIVKTYEKVAGKQLNIHWGKRPYRNREVMNPWDRGKTLGSWKSQVQLEDGIEKTINFNKFPGGGVKYNYWLCFIQHISYTQPKYYQLKDSKVVGI